MVTSIGCLLQEMFLNVNYRIVHIGQNWADYLICLYKTLIGLVFLSNFLIFIFSIL